MALRTKSLLLIIVTTVLLAYLICSLHYFYRSTPQIDILQCDIDNFQPDMLRERQPLVCRGLLKRKAFQDAAIQPAADAFASSLYSAVGIEPSPFCWAAAPKRLTSRTASPPDCIVRGWHAKWLIFQLDGACRVSLYHPSAPTQPSHPALEPHPSYACPSHQEAWTKPHALSPSVEIILRAGDGVFVPTGWYVSMHAFSTNALAGEMTWNTYLPEVTHVLTRKFILR